MHGIEIELVVLLILQTLGTSFFSKFEAETPVIKRLMKWMILNGVTIGSYFLVGHLSLIFPLFIMALGATFHFTYCKKNAIHPLNATPRKKYYELRGWKWQE
jgi:hypothetical protein